MTAIALTVTIVINGLFPLVFVYLTSLLRLWPFLFLNIKAIAVE